MNKRFFRRFISLVTNRLLILFAIFVFGFFILAQRLFDLQIVNGELYALSMPANIYRQLEVPAARGCIYDRFGRPLAVNKTAFCVKFDPGTYVADTNAVAGALLKLFEANSVSYVDVLPVSMGKPYEFTFSGPAEEQRWKTDMGMEGEKADYSAAETMEYLKEYFNIPPELPESEARSIVSIRTAIFLQRFRRYNTITLARDVNRLVVIEIEEQGEMYPGVFIDTESLRYYPEGDYISHILGYIRQIDQAELDEMEDRGYINTDLVGKLGIEKSYEHILSGTKGLQIVEMTPSGKPVSRSLTVPPVSGGNVYLTLDISLQKKVADILQKNLSEVLLYKLESGEITAKKLFSSMIGSNNISLVGIMKSENDSVQSFFRSIILDANPEPDIKNFEDISSEDAKKAKEALTDAIESGKISSSRFLLFLNEQGPVSFDPQTVNDLHNGKVSPLAIIKEKIISGEITPQATNLDPCTGAAAVVDVRSGDVMALVTYPSYDNNMLVNNFDGEYYKKLLADPTTPLINRPLYQRKAPGSTLKMLSAIAGLETGVISPSTKIQDRGVFESAGHPYANCLIYSRFGSTHGAVNVSKAIEVSCNYFFYEMAYRIGNAKAGTSLAAIGALNEYMQKFGLFDYSGLGIEEYRPIPASPGEKEKSVNEPWSDGDTIRSAIGQSVNSYTVIHMAKYIATLANGGTRYSLNLIGGVKAAGDSEIIRSVPQIEEHIAISPENLKAVHEGMLGVTAGSQGTLRNLFSDFPIKVAGKTGTAEESSKRPSHTWFTGFAPYGEPEIAVVVMIPFGETAANAAAKTAKEIFAEYFGIAGSPTKAVGVNCLVE